MDKVLDVPNKYINSCLFIIILYTIAYKMKKKERGKKKIYKKKERKVLKMVASWWLYILCEQHMVHPFWLYSSVFKFKEINYLHINHLLEFIIQISKFKYQVYQSSLSIFFFFARVQNKDLCRSKLVCNHKMIIIN